MSYDLEKTNELGEKYKGILENPEIRMCSGMRRINLGDSLIKEIKYAVRRIKNIEEI